MRGQTVNVQQLVRALTRSALGAMVFLVFLLSVLASPQLNWDAMLHAGIKAALAGLIGQVFLLAIFDTVVRSIVSSATEAQVRRRDGGLLFHFLKPDPDEVDVNKTDSDTMTSGQVDMSDENKR
jgi:hypothetical protein